LLTREVTSKRRIFVRVRWRYFFLKWFRIRLCVFD